MSKPVNRKCSLSQRESYYENREKYYDFVISSYQHGMTVREIAQQIPLSKSTVQRWTQAHLDKDCPEPPADINVPRTVGAVAKQIKAMSARITELETMLKESEKKLDILNDVISVLKEGGLV